MKANIVIWQVVMGDNEYAVNRLELNQDCCVLDYDEYQTQQAAEARATELNIAGGY